MCYNGKIFLEHTLVYITYDREREKGKRKGWEMWLFASSL